jgi:hypothetical protein
MLSCAGADGSALVDCASPLTSPSGDSSRATAARTLQDFRASTQPRRQRSRFRGVFMQRCACVPLSCLLMSLDSQAETQKAQYPGYIACIRLDDVGACSDVDRVGSYVE